MAKIIGYVDLGNTVWGREQAARARAARERGLARARADRERAARVPLVSPADAARLKAGLASRPWVDCI